MEALEQANRARSAGAALLREIKAQGSLDAGADFVAGLLAEPSDALLRVQLLAVLKACPRFTVEWTDWVFACLRVTAHDARVRDLTVRQRGLLVEILRERAWRQDGWERLRERAA